MWTTVSSIIRLPEGLSIRGQGYSITGTYRINRSLRYSYALFVCLFVQARDELVEQLDTFHDQVVTVSRDMTTAQWKRAQRSHAAEAIPIE